MSITVRSVPGSRIIVRAIRVGAIFGALAASSARVPGSGLPGAPSSAAPVTDGRTSDQRSDPAFDIAEPAPLLSSDWTPRALAALSLATLEYSVTNASRSPVSLTATLLWDAGTTKGRTRVVDHFTVPAGQTRLRRLDPQRIPVHVRGDRYPGLIQLSLESREGEIVVLPELFVMPRTTDAFPPAAAWPYELMDASRLEAATREITRPDEEGGACVRLVEWQPSHVRTLDRDGGDDDRGPWRPTAAGSGRQDIQ